MGRVGGLLSVTCFCRLRSVSGVKSAALAVMDA